MRSSKNLIAFLVVLLAVSAAPVWLQAQTAASGYVSGTVSDPTGAVVPGAEVKLEDPATGTTYTVTTNAAGRYVFPSVAPALYKITASMQGFRTATVSGLKVDIAKSYTQNFTLEVGAVEQVVEVTAGAAVELQTTDAAVGSTVGGEALLRMPSASRSVAGLLLLQPNTIPGRGETNLTGGQVAGARSDQNTYLIDGGEATSNVEGTGGYNTGQAGEPVPMIPVPVDSIEEFRVSTTNQNATFGRSQGGQIVLTTKRGTNTVHGSAYWYHQNDNLNANTWTNNRTGIDKQELKDNRYGFTVGGPIVKNSTWLFGHFEGRRFPRSSEITRLVPTAAMRAGILVFTDAEGNDVQYDLNGTTGCLGGACDPRARGLSPVVADVYNILPVGNDTALGDGLNTIGFRATVDNTLETNFFVARLDQKITDRWNFFASYRYFNQLEPSLGQIDISNLLGKGVAPAASNPLEPRYIVGGFSGQITPNLTSETRISWYRHWWLWDRTDPFPPVASSGIALALAREGAGGLLSEPINFDAQRARDRLWNGKDTFVSENLSWIKGSHTIQFGGSFRDQHIIHTRSDKVTGGLTGGPTAFLERGGSLRLSTADRPPACSAIVTTNCLQSGDLAVWDDLYALTLGIVDNATRVIVNDSNFIPQPNIFGNTVDVTIQATEVYAQDIWRVTPGLTVTFGLTYQVQVPPEEATGRQSFPVFADTLSPVVMEDYLAARASAALQGQFFDPDIAYLPMTEVAGRTRPTEIDWNNFGPRIAAAWNPSFSNWFFGDRKTVIRGGWSETFARMNGVGLVMTPALGPGVSTLVSCTGPDTTGACVGGTTASTAFRLGPDGNNISLPAAPSGFPLVPTRPWGETRAFMIDPGMTPGRSHSLDLTWQRELPGNLILEFGYVGRLGRNLQQAVDVNAVPFFFTDPASGQTIAQAWQAVAEALRAGTTVAVQPFFESMLDPVALAGVFEESGVSTCGDLSAGSCTGALVDLEGFDIENGFFGDTFLIADLLFVVNSPTGTFSNNQSLINNWVTDGGRSNYHSGFVSLRKRMSQGLSFDVNYTLGRSLDQVGLAQQWISGVNDPWDFDKDYTDSIWDRTHVLNAMWYYELPFGRGRRFASESALADKIVGGWYMSGIYTAASGLPLCVFAGDGASIISTLCAIPSGALNTGGNTEHFGVTGSNGIGTSGTTGLNLFGDPEAVFNSFRRPSVATESRFTESPLRGLPRWNVDIQLGKKTTVTENVNIVFSFDFLNIFNRVEFSDPSTSFFSRSQFGVLSGQFNTPRVIQFGFRIEF